MSEWHSGATRICRCGYNGDLMMCIDGEVYQPCESDHCGGVCEMAGRCKCTCHPDNRRSIMIDIEARGIG